MDNTEVKDIVIEELENIGILVPTETNFDTNLTEYVIDSLAYISFIVSLEEKLEISIPDTMLNYDVLNSLNGFIGLVCELYSEQK